MTADIIDSGFKWIGDYEGYLVKKLKSVRLSYKMIVDILNNLVLSFQRLLHHFREMPALELSASRLINQTTTEQVWNTHNNMKKCLDAFEQFINKSLTVVNNLIIEFHGINEIIESALVKLSKTAYKTSSADSTLIHSERREALRSKIKALKQLIEGNSNTFKHHQDAFGKDLTQLLKILAGSAKSIE